MASLQYSSWCAVGNSKPFSTKPIIPNARRVNVISCNHQKPNSSEGVDRRNMLLGLGGLYGAANLITNPTGASANPIEPPDFTKCGKAHVGDVILDDKCCPPLADTIQHYKLPVFTKLNVRPAAHHVTKEYVEKYEEAIRLMKKQSVDDPDDPRGFTQQANVHCAYCNGAHDQVNTKIDIQVHNSWLFFPFHRWYIYFFEKIMGKMIGDTTFTLPFWNWDNNTHEALMMPSIFDNTRSSLYDCNRNQNHRPPALADLTFSGATDEAQIIKNNQAAMNNEFFRSVSSTLDFMGKPYSAGDDPPAYPRGGTVERGSHTAIHAWVGDPRNRFSEDMGNFYSAGRDALFYCHHGNVDRMWTIWRDLKTDVPKDITEKDFLDASFLFYDEEKRLVRVTVADCVDHTKLGYTYEEVDIPWLDYRPSKRATKANVRRISKGAQPVNKVVFPLTLSKTTRVVVPKSAKGRLDEVLVVEDIVTDATKFIKFDVFINDEDDDPKVLDKAEYAGTFAQVPQRTNKPNKRGGSINLKLTDIYDDIDIADDDTVVVTLIPRSNGQHVTIGGLKIIPAPAN